jgi:hypothetical protein
METTQPTNLAQLEQQHREYEQQLSALVSKPYLSPDEELEETRLKKLKLHVKDQLNHLQPSPASKMDHSTA